MRRTLFTFLIVLVFTGMTVASADSPALEGDWYGALNVPASVLHLKLTIKQETGARMSAVLVSIDQGGATIPVSAIDVVNDSLRFSVATVGASFAGKIVGTGDTAEIQGDWSQGGMDLPLTFKRTGDRK